MQLHVPLSQVKTVSAKLARFLRTKEEEEMALLAGKRQRKAEPDEVRAPARQSRWASRPDFTWPTSMIDRPRTDEGSTTFHFSCVPVSRKAVPTAFGQPVEGRFEKEQTTALEHSKYIERDGAAERSSEAQHAAYVEREQAVESSTLSASLPPLAAGAQSLLGVEAMTELDPVGDQSESATALLSVFSNISDDPWQRQEFWEAVERCERVPRQHYLLLDPLKCPRWWQELALAQRLDSGFKAHALQVAQAYGEFVARESAPGTPTGRRFKAEPFKVTAEQAGRIIGQLRQMAHYRELGAPITFKSGRGGRTQIRFVAELPHEITPEDRATIVRNFCSHLGSLEERPGPDGTPQKVGMMYTAVIHAPDAHNDRRNFHLHLIAYDRPCRFLHDEGLWDFEFVETYKDPKSRKMRVRHPHRQNKIEQFARGKKDGSDFDRAGFNFARAMRAEFAEITNEVLRGSAVLRRYDERTYAEIGIDRTPTTHLGTNAAALESVGIDTAIGRRNAVVIWKDAERLIRRQMQRIRGSYNQEQKELASLARELGDSIVPYSAVRSLTGSLSERKRLSESLPDLREELMMIEHWEAKAKSRAMRTERTCVALLQEMDQGRAPAKMIKDCPSIQKRLEEAKTHLAKIDSALEPDREMLAAAAKALEAGEKRIAEIDRALQPVKSDLRKALEAANRASRIAASASVNPNPALEIGSEDRVTTALADPKPVSQPADLQGGQMCGSEGRQFSIGKAPLGESIKEAVAPEPKELLGARPPLTPLQPASIEGQPIVKPLIAPHSTIAPSAETSPAPPASNVRPPSASATPDPARVEDVPSTDRLERGEPERAPPRAQPRTADASASQEPARSGQNLPASLAMPQDLQSRPSVPATSPGPSAGATSQAVKKMPRDVAPPAGTAAATEAPQAPIAPRRDTLVEWDRLINRIADERIPVAEEQTAEGHVVFSVPSLGESDRRLLSDFRRSLRTQGRLRQIRVTQQQEIHRLVQWIRQKGRDPSHLRFEGGQEKIEGATQAIDTLRSWWGQAEAVREAIRAEYHRRAELQEIPVAADAISEVAPPLEGAGIYPTPDQAHTPELADFIRLLRAGASEEKLREAAETISENAAALQDVDYHTIELAHAFERYRPDEGHFSRTNGMER